MKYEVKGDVEEFVKSYFFLAYKAAGGPSGMGFFQARENVTPDQVINNVRTNGDYIGNFSRGSELYGDYVFGRMMKTGITVEGNTIKVREGTPRASYQGWASVYNTYEKLVEAAAEDAGVEIKPISE